MSDLRAIIDCLECLISCCKCYDENNSRNDYMKYENKDDKIKNEKIDVLNVKNVIYHDINPD